MPFSESNGKLKLGAKVCCDAMFYIFVETQIRLFLHQRDESKQVTIFNNTIAETVRNAVDVRD
jgi:uncharacterized protein YhbP (UPF0306 family)